ncbi:helix-turn-helix domain-containing protein [Actinomadura harenae]|nr:helix-turn-helix transcriptional regulator [Actinomadura harenae]
MRRRRLGAELRRLRESAGKVGDEVSTQLGWYSAKVSKIETGRITVGWGDVADLLDLYGVPVGEQRDRLIALARESKSTRRDEWWQPFNDLLSRNYKTAVDLETSATSLRIFEPFVIPGLLQNEDYARAIIKGRREYAEEEVERRVELRMKRQAVVATGGNLDMWVILDEAALRREIGGPEVMSRQLRRLLEVAEAPGVQVQVVPFGIGPHAAMSGSFGIFSFSEETDPDVVFVETIAGTLYLERNEDIAASKLAFEHLHAAARDLAGSLELISAAARTYEQR